MVRVTDDGGDRAPAPGAPLRALLPGRRRALARARRDRARPRDREAPRRVDAGTVTVESTVGKGHCFTIDLPTYDAVTDPDRTAPHAAW